VPDSLAGSARPARFGRRIATSLSAVALVLVAILPNAGATTTEDRCNGSARLCDLSLGAVAFATTHNSMASSVDGFVPPNQGRSIAQQLRHGIRGFQIDVYPGVARKGRVWTDLAGPFGSQATDLPRVLVAAATRIHRQLGAPPPGTPTEVYLCHTFCELGATKLSTAVRQFRSFLDDHPREVLAFVVEDYIAPERIREVLDAAGLGGELSAVVPGGALPTLGGMIATGHRMFVSLENGDGGPTMPHAFAGLVEETPFTFTTTRELRRAASCDPNRGTVGSPVFQLNHWVTPAGHRRSRAVNYRVLRDRVAECARLRGRGPTLVAVDFAEDSDVLAVVDRLNRAGA
jgi:hypothetical protein